MRAENGDDASALLLDVSERGISSLDNRGCPAAEYLGLWDRGRRTVRKRRVERQVDTSPPALGSGQSGSSAYELREQILFARMRARRIDRAPVELDCRVALFAVIALDQMEVFAGGSPSAPDIERVKTSWANPSLDGTPSAAAAYRQAAGAFRPRCGGVPHPFSIGTTPASMSPAPCLRRS